MQWMMRICGVLAVVMIIAAGVLYWQEHEAAKPKPNFVLDQTQFELNDFPAGDHEFVIQITNPADIPRRIIGMAEG
jgi:hypothetical protein